MAAALVLLLGGFLCLDNPTVSVRASDVGDRGPAGEVDCAIAPWDAGLNDNRDGPGGEHSRPYSEEVAAACYSASTLRFRAAVGSGALALLMLGVGVVVAVRSTNRTPTACTTW